MPGQNDVGPPDFRIRNTLERMHDICIPFVVCERHVLLMPLRSMSKGLRGILKVLRSSFRLLGEVLTARAAASESRTYRVHNFIDLPTKIDATNFHSEGYRLSVPPVRAAAQPPFGAATNLCSKPKKLILSRPRPLRGGRW